MPGKPSISMAGEAGEVDKGRRRGVRGMQAWLPALGPVQGWMAILNRGVHLADISAVNMTPSAATRLHCLPCGESEWSAGLPELWRC